VSEDLGLRLDVVDEKGQTRTYTREWNIDPRVDLIGMNISQIFGIATLPYPHTAVHLKGPEYRVVKVTDAVNASSSFYIGLG
jgi:hypothetical protein